LIPKYEYDAYNELKQYSPKIEIGGKNERVVSVEMSKKGLKEVPDKAYVFYDVQKIDLSENQITKLIDIIYRQRTSDKWYPKFEKDIPYAECDTVKADYFKGLNSLKELNLANNPIDWNDPDNKGVLQRLEARGVKVYR
jgi:Leucine-rich repeat (LRR) protein